MAITLRSTKGSALTYTEMDANFQTITDNGNGTNAITPDINGGSIDGATIGATTPSTGRFTSVNTTTTATNYLIGNTGISASPIDTASLKIGVSDTNTGTNNFFTYVNGTIPTTTTAAAYGVATQFTTAAGSFTLGSKFHFRASASTLGAGSAITNEFGFYADALTGASVTMGFYSNIADGTNQFNFNAAGTAPNSFSGDVVIRGAGKLGYTTGSGGAVTQETSRTTGVTLNKTNGTITLVSAAGSTSWQTFTVTNSTVAATDTVHICQKSGADLHMVHVTKVANGSFQIAFATTGGTTTEQPVFNFAVIKGVTS